MYIFKQNFKNISTHFIFAEKITVSKNTNSEFRNEHDALFKTFFSVKETMLDYLNNFFPAELLVHIDLNSLSLDPTNYMTSDMKAFQSDTVYRAFLKLNNKKSKPLAIVFLLEHKSFPFAYIFIQILTYMCRIWNDDIQNKRKLSFILPIVVYQSKKTWNYKSFKLLFKGLPIEFQKFIPSFDYHLTKVKDVEKEILEKLKGVSILQSLFLAYQELDNKDFLIDNFKDLFISFKSKPELQEILTMFFGYVTRRTELSAEEIEKKVKNLFNKTENSEVMSTYDSIITKGKIEGKIEGILKSLKRGKLSLEEIAEDFDVTITFVLKIKKENNL